jgi:hypothetical protein
MACRNMMPTKGMGYDIDILAGAQASVKAGSVGAELGKFDKCSILW